MRLLLQFITPVSVSLPDILDCALVADTVLFMIALDPDSPVDHQGQMFLTTLLSQGLSATGMVGYAECYSQLESDRSDF